MASLLYVRPDEQVTLYAGVSATVDSDYTDDWLCDGRPGRPIRSTSGAFSATVTPLAAGEVGLVAVCHHNLDASKAITFGGGLSATVTCNATTPPNGIPLNPFTTIAPVSVSSFTVSITGNSVDVVLGEIIAGKSRSLTRPVYTNDETAYDDFVRQVDMDLASIPPFDPALIGRTWSGAFIVTTSERDDVLAWFQAQRSGTRPSLIVPDATVNDAWVGFLQAPRYSPVSGRHWNLELRFVEIPRVRW